MKFVVIPTCLTAGTRTIAPDGLTNRRVRRWLWYSIWCTAMLPVACRDERAPTEPRLSSAWLTGNATEALGADGRFRLHTVQRHPLTEITAAQATLIASTWTHSYGPWLRGAFEQDRGASVDPRRVEPCGRVFYADTPYQDLPPTASHTIQTVFGPWWLVTLCDERGPAVSLAVSAYSTNLQVHGGTITGIGNELFATGIPTKLSSVPISPEEAVQLAVSETGARVSEVPSLVMAPRPSSPQTAKWLITLDRPIAIRGLHSGTTRTTNTIFVGFEDTWHTKAIQASDPSAPTAIVGADSPAVPPGTSAPQLSVTARPGFATAIERVEVVKS
jgi:hypothetical protein